ncbi:hypothetical protein Barb7_02324 [Bacteroidales bacterium Barb7]|nr:hypothetical protein Barb7_02324 [Bacteroidales bacterium Barb7]
MEGFKQIFPFLPNHFPVIQGGDKGFLQRIQFDGVIMDVQGTGFRFF